MKKWVLIGSIVVAGSAALYVAYKRLWRRGKDGGTEGDKDGGDSGPK